MKLFKYIFLLLPFLICKQGFAQGQKKDSAVIIRYAPPVEVVENNMDSGKDEQVRISVEKMPQFPGGRSALMNYIAENLEYPKKARKKRIQGKVYVMMLVNKDGSLSDIQVTHSPDTLLSLEAYKLVKNMPNWIPAESKGEPVKAMMRFPVVFKLNQEEAQFQKDVWIDKN